ncbi:MAG: response regulator transcription factor [Paludibacteraceae bacterium]|jgi:DNA-binding LytR/AlgR family response regulator|nr:response regulator transcription factor [Paludibacteraceae bacterium]
MTNVLIIEDEIKTAKELRNLIETLREDFNVVNIVGSIESTNKWLDENEEPDLIFSDIQLADGLSFEIFRNRTLNCPIIFCTAFDEYAIQAFDANGIDYLLKPIDEEKLTRSLNKFSKIMSITDIEEYKEKLNQMLEQTNNNYKKSLLIYFKDKIIPIKTENIDFIHSESGLVTVYLNNGQRYIVNYTLDALEKRLNPQEFYKANRQFIINRRTIQDVEHYFTRRLIVRLKVNTPDNIIISKVKATDFLRWVETN